MSTLTTINGSDVISTSRTTINNNFSALNSDKIETSVIDTDTTLAANSDSKIASQKATKAYADSIVGTNASETVKGIVEEATDAEVTAGTATGATGAKLFITPAKLSTFFTSAIPIVRTYLTAASPATWTKPSGLKYIKVQVQAAGGNGGTGNSTSNINGGGGGGGGYSEELIAAASLGSTETVTIGAVGANSSFGSHLSATYGTNASTGVPGDGGVGSGGTINARGGHGLQGFDEDATGSVTFGDGGASQLSQGGAGKVTNGGVGDAGAFGSGGGGGSQNTDSAGGAGGAAIVIVTEYYS